MRGYNQPTSENRRRQFGAEFRRRQSGEEDKKSQWRRSCLLPLFTCSHTRVKATSHFIPPRGASRWRAAPRWRESLAPANRAARLHCPTRDPAATAGSRTSPRRLGHSTAPSASRRCSPRVSALPDILCAGWPCVGGGGAQGCASARGLRRGFGGLTGGLRAARLMAGPLWRPAPDVTMRLLWRDWRQALPASGTAWVVRRVLRASCVYGVVAERRSFRKHLVSFGATGAEARSSPRSCWPET